ncbi:polyphenol oxidase family protein [Arthrobacter sp. zg-Y877]|nr:MULTISPECIES: polyphenol oxidase family protein [unclassified Arthrobacter]MCC9145041.1 polyphenol oxidase family protein [Arthrobacter sp. zg-Y919]MDK1276269.1 polyphenol oxidase family protein [Arthrobacter sp. zg.Y919]MDM7988908.1 polyphenol oxidase family protein [Arthrobacter sp. zg-Y877]WIB04554.1 polyphenol oxidase family protein [Arthrobacter sp. zg-Y919]
MFWWHRQVGDNLWVGFTNTSAGNLALHVGDDPQAVLRRRAELESVMGVQAGSLRFMNQVHSAVIAEPGTAGTAPTADGLISVDGSAPLAVMVADCVPVLLAGIRPDGNPVTAAVHAGRRGLLDNILPAAVERIEAAGGAGIRAWIGPCVCGECYEVPAAMQSEAAALLPSTAATTRSGTPALDLPAGAEAQLAGLGVAVERIAGCTLENEQLFSHRRDPSTGRLAGVVWQRP